MSEVERRIKIIIEGEGQNATAEFARMEQRIKYFRDNLERKFGEDIRKAPSQFAEKELERIQGTFLTRMGDIKEKFAAALISPEAFKRQAQLAAETFNAQLLAAMGALAERGGFSGRAGAQRFINMSSQIKPMASGLIHDADAAVAALRQRFDAMIGDLRLKLAQGLIDRKQFNLQGAEAARAFNKGMSEVVASMVANGTMSEAVFVRLTRSMKDVDLWTRRAALSMHDLRRHIFDVLGVAAGLSFVLMGYGKTIQLVKDFVNLGVETSQIEGLTEGFTILAARLDTTASNLLPRLRASTKATATDMQLFHAANLAVQLGAVHTAEDLESLTYAARILGRTVGLDVEKSMNDLTIALGRQSTRVLDNLGIYLRIERAQELYARQLGKTRDQLTETEARQAFAIIGLQMAKERADLLARALVTPAERMEQMATEATNLKNELKLVVFASDEMAETLDELSTEFGTYSEVKGEALDLTEKFVDVMAEEVDWMIDAVQFLPRIADGFGNIAANLALIAYWKSQFKLSDLADDGLVGMLPGGSGFNISTWMAAAQRWREEQERQRELWEDLLNPDEPQARIGGGQLGWLRMQEDEAMAALTNPGLEPDNDVREVDEIVREANMLLGLYRSLDDQGKSTGGVLTRISEIQAEINTRIGEMGNAITEDYAKLQQAAGNVVDTLREVPLENLEEAAGRLLSLLSLQQAAGVDYTHTLTQIEALFGRVDQRVQNMGNSVSEVGNRVFVLRNNLQEALLNADLQKLENHARLFSDVHASLSGSGEETSSTFAAISEILDQVNAKLSTWTGGVTEQYRRWLQLRDLLERIVVDGPIDQLEEKINRVASIYRILHERGEDTAVAAAELDRLHGHVLSLLAAEQDVLGEQYETYLQMLEIIADARSDNDRVDAERNVTSQIIEIREGERQAKLYNLQQELDDLRELGVNEVLLAEFYSARVDQIFQESYENLERSILRVADVFTDAMVQMVENTDDLVEALQDVGKALLTALGDAALRRGVSSLTDALSAAASGSYQVNRAASGASAAGSVGGAATSIGAASAGLSMANPAVGIALMAAGMGLQLLGGLLGRDSDREAEERQFRAHLRALREAREDRFVDVTVVLPNVPIDPSNPAWKEAFAETLDQVADGRKTRVRFETR